MIAEETRALLRRAQAGDVQAAERMVEENTGLIWSVARRFFGRGVEPDDLYQLGCVGFLKAMQGFDEQFGTCFSTYAVPKIAGEIRRFLRDDGAIKVSRSLREQAAMVFTARERLKNALGREPALSELSEETGLSAEEIAQCELAAAEFFGTRLRGVSFADSDIRGIRVREIDSFELKGVKINVLQAAELARLLGVEIEE